MTRAISAAEIRGKHISPHSLRHTFAIRFLRASGNVPALSKLLGHSALTVTMRYLDHLQLDELRAAIPRVPLDGAGKMGAAPPSPAPTPTPSPASPSSPMPA